MKRRNFVLGAPALLGAPHISLAQAYPDKPVRLVVGSAAGTMPDLIARHISQSLTSQWGGAAVVVDNRAGAAGTLAADAVVRSAPDGHTLLLSDVAAWAIAPHLYKKLPYDPLKQLRPIVEVGQLPVFLVVNEPLPVQSISELVAYARKAPGRVHYGSSGTGSIQHLSGALLNKLAAVEMVHVPYKSAAHVGTAVMAGEVEVGFLSMTAAANGLAAGKLKILGVGSASRVEGMPNVPTLSESGLRGYDVSATLGLSAPAGTPEPVVAKISASVNKVLSDRKLLDQMVRAGVVINFTSTPATFAKTFSREYEKFGQLVRESGAAAD
jgi:tripartite-type tricarboxylate transporter receptor subunit TctC